MESKFYKAAFERANDALLACGLEPDGQPGKFTDLNPSAEALLGFDREQLLGMSPTDLLETDQLEAFSGDGKPRQVRLLRQDGRRVAAELHSHRLDDDGPTGVLAVIRNMSSFEALRLELERARESGLAQAGFVQEISAAMKRPAKDLKHISDYSAGTAQADEQEKQLESLKLHSEDLLSKVNDLLEFYELEGDNAELKLTETPLASLSTALRRGFLKKGLMLKVELEQGVPTTIAADQDKLRQTLEALLEKAMGDGRSGKLRVELDATATEDKRGTTRLLFTCSPLEDSDDGFESISFGTAPERLELDDDMADVALALSKKLATALDGKLWRERDGDQGRSSYKLSAPFKRWKGGASEPSFALEPGSMAIKPPPVPVPPLRILVVDDVSHNRLLAEKLLTPSGHKLIMAASGPEAIALNQSERPDIILMDVQMPHMDGLEATKAIRETERGTGRHVPVIALTAHILDDDIGRCLSSGMDAHVAKPFKKAELLQTIKETLERHPPPP